MKYSAGSASLLIGSLLALASAALLLFLSTPAGLQYSWKDPQQYYSSARNMVEGRGLTFRHYEIVDDQIVDEPLTHFPPLASVSLAALMAVSIPPHLAPTIYTVLVWLTFLVATAVLTRRLGGTSAAAGYSVAVSILTWPYLSVFLDLSSEPLFLALLTSLAAALSGVPRRGPLTRKRWTGILLLAALLPLSRYVGIFFLPALLLWWLLVRRGHSRWQLLREEIVICCAALPLAAWLLRNLWRTSTLVGHGHAESQHTLVDGLVGIGKHLTWLLLPAVRPGPIWRQLGWPAALAVVVLGFASAWVVWTGARRRAGLAPAHPVPAFLITYLLVFTVLQPFMAFVPMNRRLVTAALCLALPWCIAVASAAPYRAFHALMSVYLAVNLTFLGLLVGTPEGQRTPLRLTSPFIEDLAGNPQRALELLYAGVPSWLLHTPPRIDDLPHYLPELAALLDYPPRHLAVISNAPDLFPDHPVARGKSPVEGWIDYGECETRTPVVVVLVDWDRWATDGRTLLYRDLPNADLLRQRIESKCPHLTMRTVRHATVFFPATSPNPLTPPASGTAPPPR